ncbi:MAG: ABC transporter permease subunit [Clostridia bacterium]|nr:ABC transporter permease subunit [Clostridia bacterium]
MIKTKSKSFKVISALISVLFWILVWALLSYKINLELLLPDPISTVSALVRMARTADFWITAGASLLRILKGILIAVLLGTLMSVFTAKLDAAEALLSPVMTVIKATPIASFIILAMLWFKDRGDLPVFITVLIVLPIVWANVSAGIRSVDKALLDVAKIYKFSFAKRIFRIYVPSVVPYFLAACRASLGMAWKAGIAAEVLCTPKNAIGTQIYYSKTYLETTELFAWTLTVILLSVIIEKVLIFGLGKLTQKLRVSRTEAKNAEA